MKKQKMGKNILELEMVDCYWKRVSESTSKEGIQYRLQNPQINFHNCRFSCPMATENGICNNYISLDDLNLERGFIFEI